MAAPGARTGSTAISDPGLYASTHDAGLAQFLERAITQDQLDQAVAEAAAGFTTDGLATDDLANVVPNVGRAALGLGSAATRSVGQLVSDDAFRTTYVRTAGDLSGDPQAPTVAKVNGVAVSGTPTAGQVLKATSNSDATWADAPSGGGGGGGSTVIDGGTPSSVYGGTSTIDGGTP